MPEAQQQSSPAPTADSLLDEYLGDSEKKEQPARTPSKPPKSGRPEPETVEDEPDEDEADNADESEGEEDTEDTADEDDAEADEDEDQSEDDDEGGRFVGQNGRVKLADGTVTTVAELMRGNLRQADYTRKTQEVGTLHNELRSRLADYTQHENLVQVAIDIMAASLPPQPDPSLLQPGEGHDPVGFTSQKLLFEHASGQLQALMRARDQMAQQKEVAQGTLLKQYAMEQRDKLLSRRPELKDRGVLEKYHRGHVKTLARYGKTADDLAEVYDEAIIHMLEDLGEYHKIMDGRKIAKRKTQGVPVMAPSTRASPQSRKAKAKNADWEVLRKTGSHGAAGQQALDRILDDFVR